MGFNPLILSALMSYSDIRDGVANCDYGQVAWGVAGLIPIGGWEKSTIKIGFQGLKHVMERHVAGGVVDAGKSMFTSSTDMLNLVKRAESAPGYLAGNGNYVRIANAGRSVGIDRTTGKSTSVYTVVTDPLGNLITAYPGRP